MWPQGVGGLAKNATRRSSNNTLTSPDPAQNDLCKLRLRTTRSYVKLITDGQMGAAPVGAANIRLNAQVRLSSFPSPFLDPSSQAVLGTVTICNLPPSIAFGLAGQGLGAILSDTPRRSKRRVTVANERSNRGNLRPRVVPNESRQHVDFS